MEASLSLHRILRVTSRGRAPTVSLREFGHYESAPFTDEELARLNAYYETSEAERTDRALQAVA
jgi:hypothetical protein